jgi:hypothetical protein
MDAVKRSHERPAAGESGDGQTGTKKQKARRRGRSERLQRVQHRIEMALRATIPHNKADVPHALRSFQSFGY